MTIRSSILSIRQVVRGERDLYSSGEDTVIVPPAPWPDAETVEEGIEKAVDKAIKRDRDRGITYIERLGEPAYRKGQ